MYLHFFFFCCFYLRTHAFLLLTQYTEIDFAIVFSLNEDSMFLYVFWLTCHWLGFLLCLLQNWLMTVSWWGMRCLRECSQPWVVSLRVQGRWWHLWSVLQIKLTSCVSCFLFCFVFEVGSCFVISLGNLNFVILLPQPPKRWYCRPAGTTTAQHPPLAVIKQC